MRAPDVRRQYRCTGVPPPAHHTAAPCPDRV